MSMAVPGNYIVPTPPSNQLSSIAASNTSNAVVSPPSSTSSSDKEETTVRRRHNTIVGLLRNTMRRQSETPVPVAGNPTPANPIGAILGTINSSISGSKSRDSQSISTVDGGNGGVSGNYMKDDGKPRSLRFTFNSNTTSSKAPEDIIKEVVSACDTLGVHHRLLSAFLLECVKGAEGSKEAVKFEIEVCKLPRLKNLHGLKFKRIAGGSTEYKEICEKILASVAL